jgi:alpha-methylacyl-CoA racemase
MMATAPTPVADHQGGRAMPEPSTTPSRTGPLAGVRVLELGGLGPGPFAAMMLADMGAEVIRVDRPGATIDDLGAVLHRGRRSVVLDLKDPAAAEAVRRIADRSDALIEGYRPGVAERLGLGPDELRTRNPRLVYGRMTGWGQDGPLAQAAGHDINYLSLSGVLHAIGPADGDPVPPINLVADFGGGGMMLAFGIVCALLRVRAGEPGQVVDAAMVDGNAALLAMTYGLMKRGAWIDERGSNLLDGGAPFYRTYRCSDGRHMAVGCLEPQFYAEFLRVLGLTDDDDFASQNDRSTWATQYRRLAEIFGRRPRDEWAALFAGTDACATPVLSLHEAPEHPHNVARGTFRWEDNNAAEPMPAPRFGGTPTSAPGPIPAVGADSAAVLSEAGLTTDEIATLIAGTVGVPPDAGSMLRSPGAAVSDTAVSEPADRMAR